MKDKLKTLPQYFVPQHIFSYLMGKFGSIKYPRKFKNWCIKKFIQRYGVNLSEAAEPDYQKYPCFNDFFTRQLSEKARLIDKEPQTLISPADGVISELGHIHHGKLIQAKQHDYALSDLLGGDEIYTTWFQNGHFMTVYLSPKDYHRVHIPFEGEFLKKIHIPGKLFSVNFSTTRAVPNLFARNERVVTLFQTPHGKMAVIFVGAMIVGKIIITAQENNFLQKAQELGYFQLGSTVIILFEAGNLHWRTNLQAGSEVNMGEGIGKFKQA